MEFANDAGKRGMPCSCAVARASGGQSEAKEAAARRAIPVRITVRRERQIVAAILIKRAELGGDEEH